MNNAPTIAIIGGGFCGVSTLIQLVPELRLQAKNLARELIRQLGVMDEVTN